MTDPTPVHTFVTNVIGGSCLVQRARTVNCDTSCLEDPNSPDTFELYKFLTTEVGLNFELTAAHVLTGLSSLLTSEDVSDSNIKKLAHMLWTILGDPEHNGSEPPPLYTEAAKALYAWFLVFLYPVYIKP
jgi:hypothetical protein